MRLCWKQIIAICFWGLLTLNGCLSSDDSHLSEDKQKINALLAFYGDSLSSKSEEAIQSLYNLQSEMNDSLSFYQVLHAISDIYIQTGKLDSSYFLNREIIAYCNRSESTPGLLQMKGIVANSIGSFLVQTERRDSAVYYLEMSYQLLNEVNEVAKLPDVCINLADCYYQDGNYPLTGFYYRRALFLCDSLNLENFYFPIYAGLGQLYKDLENYSLSDDYFYKAEKYWDNSTDYEKYYYSNSRGNYYYNTKQYKHALFWFRKAYAITNTFQYKVYDAIVETNMGEIFILLERPDSSQYYLDMAKASWGDYYEQPSTKFYVEGLYASLAFLRNDIKGAEKVLLQPYDTVAIVPFYIYSHDKRMEELYKQKGNYKYAYEYRVKADVFNDSLRNMKINNNIAETSFRYQQDTTILRKDLELAEVEIKVSHWKNIAWISIFFFIIILLVATGIIIYRKRFRELRYRRQLDTINSLRMEIIRNRISPHFTFNVINTMMPALGEYKELEEPFRLLVQMLRTNLQASEKMLVMLGDEVELVKNYLQLYLLSHSSGINIEWDISEEVLMEAIIPSMSIQIPVENAVKYAFTKTIPNPLLKISIFTKEDGLHIRIQDNGVGFSYSSPQNRMQGTGNGLRMLYDTTELLNSRNINKIVFKIQNLKSESPELTGTRVYMYIPKQFNFE